MIIMNSFLLYYALILGVFCNNGNLPLEWNLVAWRLLLHFLIPVFIFIVFFSLANVFLDLIKCLALWTCHMPSKQESQRYFHVFTASRNWCIGSANWVFLGPREIYEVEQFTRATNCWQLWGNNLPGNKRESHPVGLVNAEWTVTNCWVPQGIR